MAHESLEPEFPDESKGSSLEEKRALDDIFIFSLVYEEPRRLASYIREERTSLDPDLHRASPRGLAEAEGFPSSGFKFLIPFQDHRGKSRAPSLGG